MVYTARLVIIGKTGENPFAGFVLASGSLPYRRMEQRIEKEKSKIYVMPWEGHEGDNIKFPDVDNYACIIGQNILKIDNLPQDVSGSVLQEILASMNKQVIVSFNGHMCKRCIANISDGMKPEIALDATLHEFRGLPKDARVGGIVYTDENIELGFIGINDRDRLEKRIRGYKLEKNKGIYNYVSDTSIDRIVDIPSIENPNDLARFISTDMISGTEKVLAGGVCVIKNKKFEIGIYNTKLTDIEAWTRK